MLILPNIEHALNAKHILLGDFNLYHPYWNRPLKPIQHAAANQLLDIIEIAELKLVFFSNTVT